MMAEFDIVTLSKGTSTEIIRENYSLDKQGISNWLKSKSIICNYEILSSFHDLTPWMHTGEETYCTSFRFTTNLQSKHILIKAVVTFSPEKSMLDWVRRRKILFENKIPVSNWYYYGKAVIFEDYYPETAKEIVAFEKLLNIGFKLDELGFTTLKFLDDLRADKFGNPFFVDFGFDLGEPSENRKTNAKEYLIKEFTEKKDEIDKFYEQKLS